MTQVYHHESPLIIFQYQTTDPAPHQPILPLATTGIVTSTAWKQFHGAPLIVSWLLLVNIAIIIAALRWQRYTFLIHVLMAIVIIGLTLGASIPALQNNTFLYAQGATQLRKVHNVAGFMVVVWLGIQIITGILSRVTQYSPKINPNSVRVFKIVHQISGYLLTALAKITYLISQWRKFSFQSTFVLLLVAEIPFFIIYLFIKFGYWNLSEETVDSQIKIDEKHKQQLTNSKNQNFEYLGPGRQIVIKQKPPNNLQTQKKKDQIRTAETLQSANQIPDTYRPIVHQNQPITVELQKGPSNQKLRTPFIDSTSQKYFQQSSIPLEKYVLFIDFVYNISDFSGRHPGGQKIMSLMNKRQVNRFMYGSYSAELTPTMKPWKHSKDSMRLVGPPVGQMVRSSAMQGLDDYNRMSIHSKTIISATSSHPTVLLNLNKQTVHNLQWKGFTHVSQIGQYFSLTISNIKGRHRVTRLYTNIWCMRPQNIQIMNRNFPQLKSCLNNQTQSQNKQQNNVVIQSNNTLDYRQTSPEVVPLVIKRYQKGQLTKKLLSEQGFNGEIILSKTMGPGMKYGEIEEQGKVIIFCGGTGLLPFCDFIDLLFKRVIFLQGKPSAVEFTNNDPLIREDLIKNRSFKIYCAAESISDLLPLTLFQIQYLTKSQKIKFEAIFRVHRNVDDFIKKYPSIKTQKEFFNQKVADELKHGSISQIYVCGPPGMNAGIGQILQSHEQGKKNYHFM